MKKSSIQILLFLVGFTCFGQNTILWKVSDTISGKSSFLVGTFHHIGNSFVDSIPELKNALFQSELAIFESIEDVENTIRIINTRKPSLGIERGLKKKDLEKLKEISKNWKVDIYKLKPIELRWKLEQEFTKIKCKTVLPNDKWDHFDNYLIHLAKENGIKIYGLETDSLQLNLIAEKYEYPEWKKERKNINYFIQNLTSEGVVTNDCSFTNEYREFDLDYEFDKNCEDDILVIQRNRKWMEKITNYLKSKNCFIAVGYMHLRNKCGLLEQLKEKGFIIESMEIKPAGNIG